jgi:hypothetical protein
MMKEEREETSPVMQAWSGRRTREGAAVEGARTWWE